MGKKKLNNTGHVYTDEQNVWNMSNSKIQRTELVKAINKKFYTKLSPVAVAKRSQRMNVNPIKATFQAGGSDSPHGIVSTQEIFDYIKDNKRLFQKHIDKL